MDDVCPRFSLATANSFPLVTFFYAARNLSFPYLGHLEAF